MVLACFSGSARLVVPGARFEESAQLNPARRILVKTRRINGLQLRRELGFADPNLDICVAF